MKYQVQVFVLPLLFVVAGAHGHETEKTVIYKPLTSDMADVTKHCVYKGKLYSRGSVVRQADGNRVCEKVSFGAEPFMLGWDKSR
ncbi:MAG: hypothetical protein OIF57_16435 [Marinobacterium sp.]|nr:hypothetical protein [Marinobacterium sp.]